MREWAVLLEALDQGVMQVDGDERVTLVNPWLADRLGRPGQQIIFPLLPTLREPIPLETLFPHLPEATREALEDVIHHKQGRVLSPIFHHPIFPIPGNGPGGWMRQFVSIAPLQNQPGALVLIQDVTERMAFEAGLEDLVNERTQELAAARNRLRSLLDTVGEAVLAVDLEGVVTEWNPAAERIYGWSAAEAIGQNLARLTARRYADPELNHERVREIINSKGVWRGRLIERTKSGRAITVAATAALLRDTQGRPVGIVGVSRDVTESERLNAALQRAERLNRAISRGLTLPEIYITLRTHLAEIVPHDWLSVHLASPTDEVVHCRILCDPRVDAPADLTLPLDGSLLAILRHTKLPLAIPDVQTRELSCRPMLDEAGIRSLLALPLTYGQEVSGLLLIGRKDPDSFSSNDADLLSGSVEQVAIAVQIARQLEENRRVQAQLEQLSRRLVRTQEEERARLTRELHDELGQSLTVLKLNLTAAAAGDACPETLAESQALAGHLLDQVRALTLNLRPMMLDDLGLVPALRWYLERATRQAGIKTFFNAPEDFGRLGRDAETVFFRTAQEAVTNTLRHAGADNLWVQLSRRRGAVTLQITDDGRGFEIPDGDLAAVSASSLGLRGMMERASLIGADLAIESASGNGTQVSLVWRENHAGADRG